MNAKKMRVISNRHNKTIDIRAHIRRIDQDIKYAAVYGGYVLQTSIDEYSEQIMSGLVRHYSLEGYEVFVSGSNIEINWDSSC